MQLSTKRQLQILDFDIETRLVGFHYGGKGKPQGSEPIAIAAKFLGQTYDPYVWVLGEDDMVDMLKGFKVLYDSADIVTGHYIRKFDLPILNGAMFEHGLPLLKQKLYQDTKLHLVDFEGQSKSQENLSETVAILDAMKFHMNDARWRKAARLDPAGLALTRKRVRDDILQHIALRQELIDAGALKTPTLWKP